MTDEDSLRRGSELELHLKSYLEKAIEEVDNPFEYFNNPGEVPKESVLTNAGLINHNKISRRVRGGKFEADAIVDARYCVYGRVASKVAEQALEGWKIAVVNVEDAVITGSEEDIVGKYRKRKEIGSDQGPRYPKRPEQIFKRAVRGMLPYKKPRGRKALENVRAYVENPYEMQGIRFDGAGIERRSTTKFITLGELSNQLGV